MNAKQFKNKIKLVKQYLPSKLDVMFISVFGSYNYNLQTSTSDVDFKVVYIPTLDDLIKRQEVSVTVEIANMGLCDVMSLPHFIERVKEYDLSKLEILFAKYVWVNEEHKLTFEKIKEVVLEMVINNKKAFGESVLKVMENIFGTFIDGNLLRYSGKKAYNVPRLKLLLNKVLLNNEYDLVVDNEFRQEIFIYKIGNVSKEDATINCKAIIDRTKEMIEDYENMNYDYEVKLDKLCKKKIKTKINRNLSKTLIINVFRDIGGCVVIGHWICVLILIIFIIYK